MTQPNMADAMANFLDLILPVREAVLGYRHSLIEAGVGQDVADMMSADFHRLIVETIVKQMP